jgi:RHH-type proline utilization regulon transcriptional repressor/proline dehydrogenase/delta 1-pyrroline-5-carboxylate dehydrogenase
VHSRIDETIERIVARARVGNVYVNRNMIGAVVGVQPFGGEGLSGTGPKAGGPCYVRRLVQLDALRADARAHAPSRESSPRAQGDDARAASLRGLRAFVAARGDDPALAAACATLAAQAPADAAVVLRGPTGQRDTWSLVPRRRILCIAAAEGDRLMQLAAVLAAGADAAWIDDAATRALLAVLPADVRRAIVRVDADRDDVDAALVAGDPATVAAWSRRLAARDGAIVVIVAAAPGARGPGLYPRERLDVERSVSVNTAAAGGNASLMAIG